MSLINQNKKISQVNQYSQVVLNIPEPQRFNVERETVSLMEKILFQGLIAVIHNLGLRENGNQLSKIGELAVQLDILPKYERLFTELIEELVQNGYLTLSGDYLHISSEIRSIDNVLSDLADFGKTYPDFEPHTRLMNLCFAVYGDILTGKKRATDIIFPLGSLELVEGIYNGNKQADYFNELLAGLVQTGVASTAGKKITILEIGAGTGGTTKCVLNKLITQKEFIDYHFTDLSKSFLFNAESLFKSDFTGFRTSILNIENDPLEQGFLEGAYDIIIAANVLHATRDITHTLTQLKKLLKANGVILMNEIARKELFTTLTFGLLDGWWLYEDEELRFKNNPGLSFENWTTVLEETGFVRSTVYPSGNSCSQQIIAAYSDGWIEQEMTPAQTLSAAAVQKNSTSGCNFILEELKNVFASVLQCDVKRLDLNAPFDELGVDSIMIGTLSKQLSEKYGNISATLLFEYGTINELAAYLSAQTVNPLFIAAADLKEDVVSFEPRQIGKYLINLFAELLQSDASRIDIHVPLDELGMDSIMIGELTKRVQRIIPVISSTIFFEYSTISELTQYFSENYSGYFASKSGQSISEPVQVKTSPSVRTPAIHEPIAIIGVSGKYPGAKTLDELWKVLSEGKDMISEIPLNRWDNRKFFDPLKGKHGKNYCPYGGFIDDFDQFDPLFFNISPREAERMDPQERLFLQTAWESIEDSGYKYTDFSKRNAVKTGVYVGVMYEEYQLHGAAMDPQTGRVALGANPAGIANRVSYCMDFNGPSIAIDTMCSSSLTAIHMACNDLKFGDTDVAVAGGVNLTVHPNKYLILSQGTFLSPNGRCESFGSNGQGFVPGEGVGAVVLKRLSDAQKDGDQIYATILGTAVNHGGKGNGYTIPNPASQANVISSALLKAGLSGESISYVEAHGTGTSLGDPIEIEGLTKAFNSGKKQFCKIGSIKSNIGHCESAAGISGLTKVLLQLKYKQLVPSLHSQNLNPKINFGDTPFSVQQRLEEWNVDEGTLRTAGISGFGAGGSNAHIIVQEYKSLQKKYISTDPALVVFSAKNGKQLQHYARKLKQYIQDHADLFIYNVAYTLQTGRMAMEHRLVIEAANPHDLIKQLNAFLAGEPGKYRTGYLGNVTQTEVIFSTFNELASQWLNGSNVNWLEIYNGRFPNKISLPTYPFDNKRYWFDSFLDKEIKKNIDAEIKPTIFPISKSLYLNGMQWKSTGTVNTTFPENGIAVVTMESRVSKNMFTYDLVNDLYLAFHQLSKRTDLKVVILTGYDTIFAMGGDKEGLTDLSENKGAYTDLPFLYKGLLEFDLPVITAMQGHALGGGLVLGLYGDVVLLSEKSTYSANFMNYGFTPGMGATFLLGEKLGVNIANEMLFTGKMYSGKELREKGSSVRISTDVMGEALKIAREMVTKPVLALKLLKEKLAHDLSLKQTEHIAREVEMQKITFAQPEVKQKITEQFSKPQTPVVNSVISEKDAVSGKVRLVPPVEVAERKSIPDSTETIKVTLSQLSSGNIQVQNPHLNEQNEGQLFLTLKGIVGRILHIPDSEITADVQFTELGLDSINGVEIIREINETLQLQLEGPILYEYGTINLLTAHLSGHDSKTVEISTNTPIIVSELMQSDTEILFPLKEIVAEALHLEPTAINDSSVFTELGMDSINGVEILREINTRFDLDLEGAVLYHFATLGKLANHISGLTEKAPAIETLDNQTVNIEKKIPLLEKTTGRDLSEARKTIRSIISNCLHIDSADFNDNSVFSELGMDSINGVEIIREINMAFGTAFEAGDLYQYATIDDLIKQFVTSDNAVEHVANPVNEISEDITPFELSYMQQAYWVGENKELELGGKQAHLTVHFEFDSIDVKRLDKAINQLIRRHGILRTRFLETGQQQLIENTPSYDATMKNLLEMEQETVEQVVINYVNEKRKSSPDKHSWPLFDFTVFKTNLKDQLVVNMSLLVCDGSSVAIFFKELFDLYTNPALTLEPLTISFRDYVDYQKEFRNRQKYKDAKAYWKNRLKELPLGPELAYSNGNDDGIMVHKEKKIDRETFAVLKEKVRKSNFSLSSVLCTAYTKVLATYSRSKHFSLTIMTLGREFPNAEINKILGNFSRISVLELDYRKEQSFSAEVAAVSRQIWEDQKHNSYNGIEVIRDLNIERGLLGKIAIPVTFASAFGLGYDEKPPFRRVSASLQVPQVAMDHQVCEEPDGSLLLSFDIDDAYFQNGVTDDIICSYEKAIRILVAADWNTPMESVVLEDQLAQIDLTNETDMEIPKTFLFDPFEKSAQRYAEKAAVIDGTTQLTYSKIQRLSNRIANKLKENGASQNKLIGVLMHKGWEQVPATLGIMKSGGAYLPLDPTMPESRLNYILEKAEVNQIVTTASIPVKELAFPEHIRCWNIDTDFASEPDTAPQIELKESDLAYTIFTSGSTGFPKGVMIDHRGALNTCIDINSRFELDEQSVVLALSALYFDLSVFDIFGILGCGGTIVFPDYKKLRDPGHWIKLIQEHEITVWNSVPELMNMLIEYNALLEKQVIKQLKLVMMSGDWIPVTLPERIRQFVPNAKVVSLGGATEASIWSIYHEIKEIDPTLRSIPYGKALANQTMHVLDQFMNPCPFLTTGDIYIGGIGVAKGYLKDEEKTRNQFVRHPKTKEIIYKTGDLGRVMRNGNIEFLGREDFQVKVQGYRIEMGDIEAALLRSEQVKAAVVDVWKDIIGNNYLVAYTVPKNRSIDEKELTEELRSQLQSYMIPKYIVSLEDLPVTQNGKIDRKSLPDPRITEQKEANTETISEHLTISLQTVWKELLQVNHISGSDDFFELGGNSLLAIRLAALLESNLQLKIDLSELLQNSRFSAQLQVIAGKFSGQNTTKSIVAIRNADAEGQPLFLVHPIGGSVFCYNQLARLMDPETPVYGFHATGNESQDVVKMAAAYIKDMKSVQPEGPYCIGGWSFGGIISFEMARQLEQMGDRVEDLFLIDSYFHSSGYQLENVHETEVFEKFLKDLSFQKGGRLIQSSTMQQMLDEAVETKLFPAEITMETIRKLLEMFRNNCVAYSNYKALSPVNSNTHILVATDRSFIGSERDAKAWENWLTGKYTYHELTGDHFTIFEGESLKKLVEIVTISSKITSI
ncbi:amino acid adenylation domain-containing protein [Chryseobacterium sp. RP-3-3]|uniref:Amino acid adenylation domain-containing protein n=1 Tax=Chryseobacterium antibioticum TaxID=2728847 RepID=A0A7Y0AKS9_9FLAO|nr:non-ribosomal peptide synthetase [Chryseobacterium antibioticum]NML68960.1 amino acid adenylation domain-containing protein [Chryseobacterium antibioticum]